MIKYALVCAHEHPFEGWFGASADYDDQNARGLVECPVCGSIEVRKQIMSPSVVGAKARGASEADPQMRSMMMEAMRRVRSHVTDNFDYVGDRFAVEARAIHEGASEDRGIYGEASPKEVRALIEDGVQVAPLPPEPPKKTELN
ncbi:MAG TPA: DUF1178 family protein [Caulobacteraceae bacterium]|jgi:hypothetical protein